MEIDLSQNELVLKLSNNIKEYLLQKNLSNSDISLFLIAIFICFLIGCLVIMTLKKNFDYIYLDILKVK